MALFRDLNIAIAGSGGDGVVSAGELLTAAAANEGLYCMLIKSFGPQIRGGESSIRLRLSDQPVLMQGDEIDVIVALNIRELLKFGDEITPKHGCVVIYDVSDKGIDPERLPFGDKNPTYYAVPLKELAEKEVGTGLAKNIVTLGVLAKLFDLPSDGLQKAIEKKFAKKKQAVIDSNLKALEVGSNWVAANLTKEDSIQFEYEKGHSPRLLMDGNAAFAYGALWAGCRFYAGYPITPSSEVLHWLHRQLPKYDGTVIQTEDEMAAIGMALGAAYGGVRAMTASSGPGVALMQEILGLSWAAEIGVVVLNVMRVGPSTGIPTKTEQADLSQALHGASGDAARVVLAPCDVEDCFAVAVDAFNIADRFQVPVMVLSDQFIGQRSECVKRFNPKDFKVLGPVRPTPLDLMNYKRHKLTENGVSPQAIPGIDGGQYTTAGIEHTESGSPTSSVTVHNEQNDKRYRKLEAIGQEYNFVRRYGAEKARVGLLGWGSTKGVIRKVIEECKKDGIVDIAGCVPQILNPLPKEKLQEFIDSVDRLIVMELSYEGQFFKHLRGEMDLPTNAISYARGGGKPFAFDEVYDLVVGKEATIHG